MRTLRLSQAAARDLAAIARYTEQRWGIPAKQRYMKLLRDRLAALRRAPDLGAAREEIRPGCRALATGRHVIFYRASVDEVAIIRILHYAMDMHKNITSAEDTSTS
ncbi:MAG: type II toxin-antitoxin system RelE/ParE family toxin [Alphaproteobacteria bacterium]|nr:type II toxin-antitoxin system RelE/ParE family toxin [Alphaproteobacteria bacterium]MBU0799137.1 type II toxin-antitoxin system RelE/ParE family toxin [Alphaproteobacteria bacterium]MBU0888834.1 type II toxin-antitoxin system RelE/ParE family toxin [Alphaproteobacteria bacterium]MBU1813854.1 type II toxin-antitoxin system RelE/ParE family toxin [Alphaproteobacteria bacterium]